MAERLEGAAAADVAPRLARRRERRYLPRGMKGLVATSFASRAIACLLAIGLLASVAHGAAHGHAPARDAATSVEAHAGHADVAPEVEAGCALCRSRVEPRAAVARVAVAAAPAKSSGLSAEPEVARDASACLARSGPARAPPRVA